MICQSCGTENALGRKFCDECGAALSSPCPGCGMFNRPDAKFCGECATVLSSGVPPTPTAFLAVSEPASAERRLVTVLFADLVGFTTLAEGRDAEAVRDLLSEYFELASDQLGRYGGTVEKFIGDAVMAVWGTPIAHEDDAERAVRAALELVDADLGAQPAPAPALARPGLAVHRAGKVRRARVRPARLVDGPEPGRAGHRLAWLVRGGSPCHLAWQWRCRVFATLRR